MSDYQTPDITDDEDSLQKESSSEVIEESIEESLLVESEDESNSDIDAKKLPLTRAVKRISKEKNIHYDSDSSTEFDRRTANTKGSSKSRTSSFRNASTHSLSSPNKAGKTSIKSGPTKDELENSRNESFTKSRVVSDDSDDSVFKFKILSKKNVIESDSDSESDSEVNMSNIQGETSSKPQQSLSIEVIESDFEVDNLTKSLNNSRISHDFHFGRQGNIVNSTLVDIENESTPKMKHKRSLNRSVDTPRILKQSKESTTPNCIKTSAKKIQVEEIDSMRTPRIVKEIIPSRSPSSSSSVEVLSEDDIIDVSSEDPPPSPTITPRRVPPKIIKQSTLDSHIIKKSNTLIPIKKESVPSDVIEVSSKEMSSQKEKVRQLHTDLLKAKNLLRTINLDSLPDKGKLIRDRHANIEKMLAQEEKKMSMMVVTNADTQAPQQWQVLKTDPASWNQIEANVNSVMPRTFGKQAMSTYNAQKALTIDRLQQLHGSLEGRPTENTEEKDPDGLKVELMPHQRKALAWLLWREKQKPSGGILADDMGLGKTLTMISLMLKSMEAESDDDENLNRENSIDKSSNMYKGGTLVVCPASLLNQWSGELERRTRRGLASCELYHGSKRETKPKRLSEYDMVITTYAIIMNECGRNGAVFMVKWRRIIIDEAHQIRNYRSQTSEAICRLSAKSRWALTGTPVHNKELDMYALLKFLRCTPFDDLQVWKRWVGDKSTGGQERLHTVISSLMLRRTKAELIEKGSLKCIPERKWELIPVQLSKNEMDVYQKILLFSRTLFAQFLHQRAEKNQDRVDLQYQTFGIQSKAPNQEYFKMRDKLLRFHKVKDVKQHEILVLLLRLRQICCHPSLITSMLNEDMENLGEEDPDETNILEHLNKLILDDDKQDHNSSNPVEGLASQEEAVGLSEAAKSLLNPSNPVFSKERLSSKIKAVLDVLNEKVVGTNDKAIIVSQWPSFLRLIAYHLDRERIPFDQLDGSIPVNKRMVIVDSFNNPNDKMKVLLLSLTAGGVGLNLIGANHLFLLDLHWNPQLENQAQDRIYRVGQQKQVFVYKFMATDTIEKRILDLQEKKLDIANSMLTGSKQVIGSKLSLQDLKLLFDM